MKHSANTTDSTHVFQLSEWEVNIPVLYVVTELLSQHFFSHEISWVHLMQTYFVFSMQGSGFLFLSCSVSTSCTFPNQTCKNWAGLLSYPNHYLWILFHLFIKKNPKPTKKQTTWSWKHKLPAITILFSLWWKISTISGGASEPQETDLFLWGFI